MNELLLLFSIEEKCEKDNSFYNHVVKFANPSKFNDRYSELLDKFLNQYALNKAEKSE